MWLVEFRGFVTTSTTRFMKSMGVLGQALTKIVKLLTEAAERI